MESAIKATASERRRQPILRAFLYGGTILLGFLVATRAPLPLIQSWWRAGETDPLDPWKRRYRIADGLVFSHSLIGKTRVQVVESLGEPPPSDKFREWSLVYPLGAERGFFSIDSEWLVMRVSADGHVQEAHIVRD